MKRTFLLSLLLAALVTAKTWYVSKSGSDANPGTLLLPFLTIQKGIDSADVPDDTVQTGVGTWNEHLTFSHSGTAGHPIVVRGAVDAGDTAITVIDNLSNVLPLWDSAPEVGAGVFKRTGTDFKLLTWNGSQVYRINDDAMDGNSPYVDSGRALLRLPADHAWLSFTSYLGHGLPFWAPIGCLYGTLLGDTVYLRFTNGDDPDTAALRATTSTLPAVTVDGYDYTVTEYLKIQGSLGGVLLTGGASNNTVRKCVLKHGNYRVKIEDAAAANTIANNDMTLGYGSQGTFGEWEGDTIRLARRNNGAAYFTSKYIDGYSSTFDQGVTITGAGAGNQVYSNTIHDGCQGVYLEDCRLSDVHDNNIYNMSSIGVCFGPGVESAYVHGNQLDHCNVSVRLMDCGQQYDTLRSAFVYGNTAFNYDSAGGFVFFHYADADTFYTAPPSFWFYHNSYCGGRDWGSPRVNRCKSMVWVNNVMNSRRLAWGTAVADDSVGHLFAGFDYNFCGGLYSARYKAWQFHDRHNKWSADTIIGSSTHRIWVYSAEPGWTVPFATEIYRTGLNLSASFTVRGTSYGALHGMTPGYFFGVAPNMGAVQDSTDTRRSGKWFRWPWKLYK